MSPETFYMIAAPALLGALAVGAVLLLKVTRRRQGTVDPSMTGAVPVRPLSREDARKMLRRYLVGIVALVATLATLAILTVDPG